MPESDEVQDQLNLRAEVRLVQVDCPKTLYIIRRGITAMIDFFYFGLLL